jgi:hypothetical protein
MPHKCHMCGMFLRDWVDQFDHRTSPDFFRHSAWRRNTGDIVTAFQRILKKVAEGRLSYSELKLNTDLMCVELADDITGMIDGQIVIKRDDYVQQFFTEVCESIPGVRRELDDFLEFLEFSGIIRRSREGKMPEKIELVKWVGGILDALISSAELIHKEHSNPGVAKTNIIYYDPPKKKRPFVISTTVPKPQRKSMLTSILNAFV